MANIYMERRARDLGGRPLALKLLKTTVENGPDARSMEAALARVREDVEARVDVAPRTGLCRCRYGRCWRRVVQMRGTS